MTPMNPSPVASAMAHPISRWVNSLEPLICQLSFSRAL